MFSNEWVRAATPRDAAGVHGLLGSLDVEFVAREFVVCEAGGRIVGCARVHALEEGGTELSHLVVASEHRGRGLARNLLQMALLGARHPVFLVTDRPEVAARLGFEPISPEELPPSMQAARDVSLATFAPMRLRRVEVRPLPSEDSGEPDFLDA